MSKIEFGDLIEILSHDVAKYNTCIEINFCIENDMKYKDCWLGKFNDKSNGNKAIYWYGLVKDGSQAYNYYFIDEMLNTKVFHQKSIREIWKSVNIFSLDGCSVEERITYYK